MNTEIRNEHLKPVFDELLPALREIEYWVYGGVGRAGVVGKFIRCNSDVDIFVKESDFRRAISLLEDKCGEIFFTSRLVEAWRPKFEVRVKATDKRDILSVVPVYPEDGGVEFRFGRMSVRYSDQILERIPRTIGTYEFFTPPDKWIKELLKTYVSSKPKKKGSSNVKDDARAILTRDEIQEIWGAPI